MRDWYRKTAALCLLSAGLVACSATGFSPGGTLSLSDKPLLGKFVWHDLMTDDVAAARQFYGGVLGWEFEQTTHPRGGDYTLISAGGHYVGGMVLLADSAEADFSRWLPYLSVADVDAAARQTEAAGGQALVGPLELGMVGRAAAIMDPQGAVLGLLRSRVGDPDDSLPLVAGRVAWNELLAADEARAAEFYASLAGLEAGRMAQGGREHTVLRAQGLERAGITQRPDERVVPLWLTYFAVADIAAAVRRAEELGGTVLLRPSADLRNGTLAVVTDPGGAVLALQQLPQ
jgi:predicted enzyme related to lactoylglutathione lyase